MSENAPNWIKWLNRLLMLLIGLYLIYAGILFSLQRRGLYPGPDSALVVHAFDGDSSAETLWIRQGEDSTEVRYLPPLANMRQGEAPPLVIFAHGNISQIGTWATRFDTLRTMGFGVLLPEFPGYGRSSGSPTQASLTATFAAAYDSAMTHGWLDSSRVLLMGHSLGASVVCQLATKRPTNAMILATPFVATRLLMARFFLPGFLALDPWNSLAVVKQYGKPVLVVVGRNDKGLLGHGVTLYEAAQNGALMSGPGGHARPVGDWNSFWVQATPFLTAVGLVENGDGMPEWELRR